MRAHTCLHKHTHKMAVLCATFWVAPACVRECMSLLQVRAGRVEDPVQQGPVGPGPASSKYEVGFAKYGPVRDNVTLAAWPTGAARPSTPMLYGGQRELVESTSQECHLPRITLVYVRTGIRRRTKIAALYILH